MALYVAYESGFPKSSWTNVIWFKITALLSGKHNNIFIQSMIMYMYKNQSILYWSYHYLNIAYTVRTTSLTLIHNDVSITSYSWIYLKVIYCIHRFVRGYIHSHSPSKYRLSHFWTRKLELFRRFPASSILCFVSIGGLPQTTQFHDGVQLRAVSWRLFFRRF